GRGRAAGNVLGAPERAEEKGQPPVTGGFWSVPKSVLKKRAPQDVSIDGADEPVRRRTGRAARGRAERGMAGTEVRGAQERARGHRRISPARSGSHPKAVLRGSRQGRRLPPTEHRSALSARNRPPPHTT